MADWKPLRDEADRLVRLLIGRRERCQRCQGPGSEVAHIIGRRVAATRCLEANLLWLCKICHDIFDGRHHEAMTRSDREAFVDSILGSGAMAELRDIANDGIPLDLRPLSAFWAFEVDRLTGRCVRQGLV